MSLNQRQNFKKKMCAYEIRSCYAFFDLMFLDVFTTLSSIILALCRPEAVNVKCVCACVCARVCVRDCVCVCDCVTDSVIMAKVSVSL